MMRLHPCFPFLGHPQHPTDDLFCVPPLTSGIANKHAQLPFNRHGWTILIETVFTIKACGSHNIDLLGYYQDKKTKPVACGSGILPSNSTDREYLIFIFEIAAKQRETMSYWIQRTETSRQQMLSIRTYKQMRP
jgi:hypothetical protein